MNILVTGCAGFIGSHLCERLVKEGHQVWGLDNFDDFYGRSLKEDNLAALLPQGNFTFVEADLREADFFKKLPEVPPDMVVHLAAKAGVRPSIEAPERYIDSNIAATQHLVRWMLDNEPKQLVFASSSSVYGNDTPAPFSEEAKVEFPISPYAFTKRSCELLLHTYFHLYQLSSVSLRFFTVFGPRQRPDLAINKFFRWIEEGAEISIFGDGSTSRDYTFIEDIVQGIMASVHLVANAPEPVFEIINLGNSKPTKLLDLIETIETIAGKKAQLSFQPMQPGDVNMTCADVSKAERLLGYRPATTLKEGLTRYFEWRKSLGGN